MKRAAAGALVAGTVLASSGCEKLEDVFVGDPEIVHMYVPAKGSFDDLKGKVRHVDPDDYRVSTYIYVGGSWWMKPYWNRPLTAIKSDGTWETDITTGGIDSRATQINSYLVTPDYEPASHTLPDLADSRVVTMVSSTR